MSLLNIQNVARTVEENLTTRFERIDNIRTDAYEVDGLILNYINAIQFNNTKEAYNELVALASPFSEKVANTKSKVYPQEAENIAREIGMLEKCQRHLFFSDRHLLVRNITAIQIILTWITFHMASELATS